MELNVNVNVNVKSNILNVESNVSIHRAIINGNIYLPKKENETENIWGKEGNVDKFIKEYLKYGDERDWLNKYIGNVKYSWIYRYTIETLLKNINAVMHLNDWRSVCPDVDAMKGIPTEVNRSNINATSNKTRSLITSLGKKSGEYKIYKEGEDYKKFIKVYESFCNFSNDENENDENWDTNNDNTENEEKKRIRSILKNKKHLWKNENMSHILKIFKTRSFDKNKGRLVSITVSLGDDENLERFRDFFVEKKGGEWTRKNTNTRGKTLVFKNTEAIKEYDDIEEQSNMSWEEIREFVEKG